MTKAELRAELMKGRTLDDILHFTDGQECTIFKADCFVPGDEVLYIPDIDLNQIPVDINLSYDNSMADETNDGWDPMTPEEQITLVLSYCYTGDDFINECEGDVEKAKYLFDYCDWQHPSSAYPEIQGEMTDKEFYEHQLEEARKGLMALIAKVEHPIGDRLSEILVDAVNKIEELQEEARESDEEE